MLENAFPGNSRFYFQTKQELPKQKSSDVLGQQSLRMFEVGCHVYTNSHSISRKKLEDQYMGQVLLTMPNVGEISQICLCNGLTVSDFHNQQ